MPKATEETYRKLRHFSIKENWGDPFKMEEDILFRLDDFRHYVGKPVIVHCGYGTDGHVENSQHYVGKAVDIHVVNMELIDQYLAAERFGFTGLGLYPFWTNPGMHLDLRILSPGQPAARWYTWSDGKYYSADKRLFNYISK